MNAVTVVENTMNIVIFLRSFPGMLLLRVVVMQFKMNYYFIFVNQLDCHKYIYYTTYYYYDRSEKIKKTWRCTLCEDMNTVSRDLGEDDDPENISIGTVGRKIAERMLMELYCNIDGSDFFRERPNKNVVSSILTINYMKLQLFLLIFIYYFLL